MTERPASPTLMEVVARDREKKKETQTLAKAAREAAQQEERERERIRSAPAELRGDLLNEEFLPFHLGMIVGRDVEYFDIDACSAYLQKFLKDLGDPADPIERTLVEQLAILRLCVPTYHTRAANARSAEDVKSFAGAAARLLGEMRRLALAVRDYRGGSHAKSVRLAQTA